MMSDFLKFFVGPILLTVSAFNLALVIASRKSYPDTTCKMRTLLEYFPSNWISCELTKPRFNGDNK